MVPGGAVGVNRARVVNEVQHPVDRGPMEPHRPVSTSCFPFRTGALLLFAIQSRLGAINRTAQSSPLGLPLLRKQQEDSKGTLHEDNTLLFHNGGGKPRGEGMAGKRE